MEHQTDRIILFPVTLRQDEQDYVTIKAPSMGRNQHSRPENEDLFIQLVKSISSTQQSDFTSEKQICMHPRYSLELAQNFGTDI